jgi:hypothetical protein
VACDVLGGLADLEQPLGKLLPTGSLLEKRSKAINVGSCAIQEQTVRLPPGTVRPPTFAHRQSDRQLLYADDQTTRPGWSDRLPWNRGLMPCFGYTQTCSCNGGEAFDINTLFGDSARENLWLDLNKDTLPHVYF